MSSPPESEPRPAAAAAVKAPPRPPMRVTADNFRMLRSLTGAPHPLWIIAGPLLQVLCIPEGGHYGIKSRTSKAEIKASLLQ